MPETTHEYFNFGLILLFFLQTCLIILMLCTSDFPEAFKILFSSRIHSFQTYFASYIQDISAVGSH
jgi:hypothetical protein